MDVSHQPLITDSVELCVDGGNGIDKLQRRRVDVFERVLGNMVGFYRDASLQLAWGGTRLASTLVRHLPGVPPLDHAVGLPEQLDYRYEGESLVHLPKCGTERGWRIRVLPVRGRRGALEGASLHVDWRVSSEARIFHRPWPVRGSKVTYPAREALGNGAVGGKVGVAFLPRGEVSFEVSGVAREDVLREDVRPRLAQYCEKEALPFVLLDQL